uniref:Myb-like domain-containing protein n=1 Tax=Brassica oleracea var. oleracea TaxID=109376 RepID=A0A0D3AN69_BRAOL
MDKNTSYVNLLFTQSQSSVDLDSPEPFWFGSQGPEEPVVEPVIESGVESGGKERRKWSLKEDKILIGAWLNTSKDAVVRNEQKSGQFWKRIVAYYNASPHLVGTKPRELGQCKQRWAKINEQVSKFVGCYDAALREQRSGQNDDDVIKAALDYFYNDPGYNFSLEHGWRELGRGLLPTTTQVLTSLGQNLESLRSGQNDDDVMKAALDYFYNDHGYKFSLEHRWRELRHDQKWCSTYLSNHGGKEKRKQVLEVDTEDEVGEPEARPVGVKAAKTASKRKKSGKEEELSQI